MNKTLYCLLILLMLVGLVLGQSEDLDQPDESPVVEVGQENITVNETENDTYDDGDGNIIETVNLTEPELNETMEDNQTFQENMTEPMDNITLPANETSNEKLSVGWQIFACIIIIAIIMLALYFLCKGNNEEEVVQCPLESLPEEPIKEPLPIDTETGLVKDEGLEK